MQAKNYAAQAERDLLQLKERYIENDLVLDAMMIDSMCEGIQEATHFSLPDNGKLFDDQLKGLRGIKLRLPYPKITVEYLDTNDPGVDEKTGKPLVSSPKRLVLATEGSYDMVKHTGVPLPEGAQPSDYESLIFITVFCTYHDIPTWAPLPVGWIMPQNWDSTGRHSKEGYPDVAGVPAVVQPTAFQYAVEMLGSDEAYRSAMRDISFEIYALLSLLEALACSNVYTQSIQQTHPKVNAKRIKSGKLPLYETKALFIQGAKSAQGDGGGYVLQGDRNSPRQHLRRGHIRLLQDGRRIWVNSCVVGGKGFIDKTYIVKNA